MNEDVFIIEHEDVPVSHVSFQGCRCLATRNVILELDGTKWPCCLLKLRVGFSRAPNHRLWISHV